MSGYCGGIIEVFGFTTWLINQLQLNSNTAENGPLISWMDPLTNTEIFRWDKNTNRPNGPHYHIIHSPEHYYPGMIVPEPYAIIYFPFR